MRFGITNVDSLLGRARRTQHRYEAGATQLNELLGLALDAEISGRPVPTPVLRQLQEMVEAGEKLLGKSNLFQKGQRISSKRKVKRRKKTLAKRRNRLKPLR